MDDFELSLWPDDRKGESIGFVPQDSHMFPGTIAENISRYEQYPDEEQIIAAAQRANIHKQITKLPEAYATIVGPDSQELSGGTAATTCLGPRILCKILRVLILDEPNAHLDQTAEDQLLHSLSLNCVMKASLRLLFRNGVRS